MCDRGALKRIKDLKFLVFADRFGEMDHQAIATHGVPTGARANAY